MATRRAEESTGRSERLASRILEEANTTRDAAQAAVERVTPLRFILPSTGLPANRLVLSLHEVVVQRGERRFGPLNFTITGAERVAVAGPNGAGKSSLLKLIAGELSAAEGTTRVGVTAAYLDQHVSVLEDDLSLLDNLKRCHPGLGDNEAYQTLASFAFRSTDALRSAGSLSGGERLRAGLSCVMGATSPPQLLLLDEPTNHLDVTSIEELERALVSYDGALVLVSHDSEFIRKIGVRKVIELG